MISIKEIIKKIEYLPPFNQNAIKILELLKIKETSIRSIVDTIKLDPSLTLNILKEVNSAYYGVSKKVTDINQAVNLLGRERLSEIVSISIARGYFKDKHQGYEVNSGELIKNAISTAIISKELAYLEKDTDKSILFLTGLLHDIGKIILSHYVEAEYKKIIDLIEAENIDFQTAEKKVLGFSHADVGAAIMKSWHFTDEFILVTRYHHNPERVDNPYVRIIALAEYISMLIGNSSQKDALAYKGYESLLEYYNIDKETLFKIISNSVDKIEKVIKQTSQ